jgi:hypothetical protein
MVADGGLPTAAGRPDVPEAVVAPPPISLQLLDHQRQEKLAELLLCSGKTADALACADKALLAAPASAALLHLRGRCLLSAGNIPGVPIDPAGAVQM